MTYNNNCRVQLTVVISYKYMTTDVYSIATIVYMHYQPMNYTLLVIKGLLIST